MKRRELLQLILAGPVGVAAVKLGVVSPKAAAATDHFVLIEPFVIKEPDEQIITISNRREHRPEQFDLFHRSVVSYRQEAQQELSKWLANRMDQMMFESLTGRKL